MKASTVSEMRALDREAMEKFGIKDSLLMENAGLTAYFVLLKEIGIKDKKFIVFCGVGNNGGDGFVIARKIHSNGGDVKIFVLGDQAKFKGVAKMNLDIVSGLPIEILQIKSIDGVQKAVVHSDVIIDAIFGTGLMREVEGRYGQVIDLINSSGKIVLSVDIPSGIHGDTGKIMGRAIRADYTVAFGLPKLGNLLFPGYDHCGRLFLTHISFPPSMYDKDSMKVEINLTPKLPSRKRDGHKGDFGDVLFIAGASSYLGAPYFAALSFMKAGGGYSRLAAPMSVTPFIAAKGSEIVFVPQQETSSGSISLKNRDDLLELAKKVDMVIIGSGLSLDIETRQLVRELVLDIQKPVIVDGDGITAVCEDLEVIKKRKAETILTPHLGEMSRIAKMSIDHIDANKVEVLQHTTKALNSIIVLKGAHSLIGYPDERIFVNMSGNSGMATAGSGDVLVGTIAAMFGLGLSLSDAVRKGVFIHGLSGDLAAEDMGEDGMTAQDVLDYLPLAVSADREDPDEVMRFRHLGLEVI
jgi:hydroxyethylthiazole kinase-like uncharacterized protein yjeF